VIEIGARRKNQPAPDESLTGHLRKRMNVSVNANLRSTFGQ
jgi:hypothetical protein